MLVFLVKHLFLKIMVKLHCSINSGKFLCELVSLKKCVALFIAFRYERQLPISSEIISLFHTI